MKRFYCVECKKVKRVRQWPYDVNDRVNINPTNRIGTCNHHHKLAVVTNAGNILVTDNPYPKGR